MTNFAEFHDNLIQLDAFKEVSGRKGTAVFFSAEGNDVLAKKCLEMNPYTYTINETPAGEYLNGKEVSEALKQGQISKKEYRELWNTASQMFAAEAEGPAIAFVKDAHELGTFARKEATVFGKGNGGITSINGIDINQVIQNGVDTTEQMQNTLQKIGDKSDLSHCFPPNGGAGALLATSSPTAIAQTQPDSAFSHISMPQISHHHTNYYTIAAGAVIGIASAFTLQPEGEALAASLIGAGVAGATIGATIGAIMPKSNDEFDINSNNLLQQNSKMAAAVAQLKQSGTNLQEISDSAKSQNPAAPYAYDRQNAQQNVATLA